MFLFHCSGTRLILPLEIPGRIILASREWRDHICQLFEPVSGELMTHVIQD